MDTLERVRYEEIQTLEAVITACREILQNPSCYEQVQDAREELEFAIQLRDKIIENLIH